MAIGTAYWVLMFLWLIFGLMWNWPGGNERMGPYGPFGNWLLLFILFALLGWRVFGAALHG